MLAVAWAAEVAVACHTGRGRIAAGARWRGRALAACHWARLGCGGGRAFQSLNQVT